MTSQGEDYVQGGNIQKGKEQEQKILSTHRYHIHKSCVCNNIW